MTDNGKITLRKRQLYRYNYLLANIDRLRVLSFLKNGPQTWMDTADNLYDSKLNGNKGSFAHLLEEMKEDLLVRLQFDPTRLDRWNRSVGVTIVYATAYGLEKMRQTIEEIEKLK